MYIYELREGKRARQKGGGGEVQGEGREGGSRVRGGGAYLYVHVPGSGSAQLLPPLPTELMSETDDLLMLLSLCLLIFFLL